MDEQHLINQHAVSMGHLDVKNRANQYQHTIQQIGVKGKLDNESLEILVRSVTRDGIHSSGELKLSLGAKN